MSYDSSLYVKVNQFISGVVHTFAGDRISVS